MLAAVLGWATVCAVTLTTFLVAGVLLVTGWFPDHLPLWYWKTRVRAPKEVRGLQWIEPEQDHPIPWS